MAEEKTQKARQNLNQLIADIKKLGLNVICMDTDAIFVVDIKKLRKNAMKDNPGWVPKEPFIGSCDSCEAENTTVSPIWIEGEDGSGCQFDFCDKCLIKHKIRRDKK